jgi:hypothetical protein
MTAFRRGGGTSAQTDCNDLDILDRRITTIAFEHTIIDRKVVLMKDKTNGANLYTDVASKDSMLRPERHCQKLH